jgi:hypothetical protein
MVDIQTSSSLTRVRISAHINRKPASNMAHAVRVADALGLRLNQLVTFNFARTACPDHLVSRQFQKLRDNHFGKWLARKGKSQPRPPCFVWSIENSGGCLNVHWLVHIPEGRVHDFRSRLHTWLEAVSGEVACTTAIHVRHAPAPQGAVKYMSKGIDPLYAPFFRIRHVPQGLAWQTCRHQSFFGLDSAATIARSRATTVHAKAVPDVSRKRTAMIVVPFSLTDLRHQTTRFPPPTRHRPVVQFVGVRGSSLANDR